MRVSQQWLYDWIHPGWTAQELGERLTMAGLELEAMETFAGRLDHVLVGEVLEVWPHPGADRLRMTRVNVGRASPVQIVCGAANVAPGIRVPVALPGAILPAGTRISEAVVRGEPSAGMLCSAAELGLAEVSEGLLILDATAPVGMELEAYLGLNDVVLTLGITPNRGDCLSIRGVAQEVAALSGGTARMPTLAPTPVSSTVTRMVHLDAAEACPRYCGQSIQGIRTDARSPDWMRQRLQAAGLRAIHPIVDILNYVMLELGQPMHAFDAARLDGDLHVRWAHDGESIHLLDGSVRELVADMLVIADGQGPQALAGIMGGMASSVQADTVDLFIESAFFSPMAIAGRARRLGLHSDASHRFERGVDPALPALALARAVALILQYCGGNAGPAQCVEEETALPGTPAISLRRARLHRVLGVPVGDAEVEAILGGLGMSMQPGEEGWQVVAPSARFDIAIEADLIEEVARIYGYAQVPAVLPQARIEAPRLAREHGEQGRVRRFMAARDYHEVITYSFVSAAWQEKVDPTCLPIPVQNPISQEMGLMRTSLWPGFLQTLHYNLNRQQTRVRIFELGRVFRGDAQPLMLGALIAGPRYPLSWSNPGQTGDFFDLKGDLTALLHGWRLNNLEFRPACHAALHPGQTAEVFADGENVGRIGVLHPALVKQFDLSAMPVLFEINLHALAQKGVEVGKYAGIPHFPALRRDLALLVPVDMPAGQIEQAIWQADPALIRELRLFDRYLGQGVPEGQQSLAFSLLLQSQDRTLDDEDVVRVIERVLERVRAICPVALRQ